MKRNSKVAGKRSGEDVHMERDKVPMDQKSRLPEARAQSMKEKPSPESPRMAQLAEIRRMFDCAAEMRGVAEKLHDQAVMRLSGAIRSIKVDHETRSLRVRNLRRVEKP